jgi:Ham1 family
VQIVIGTTNPAKVRQCQLALRSADLRMRSLSELLPHPPEISEDGWDAEENAARKARAYCHVIGLPVMSLDFALAFDDLPAECQPGMNVRRIPGVEGRPSDDALLDYYAALFTEYGGHVRGRWEVGAAIAVPSGQLERATIPAVRTFVSEPSNKRVDGYPLASLQLADGGAYISELSASEEEQLWQSVLGEPLRRLVAAALISDAPKSDASR